MQGKNIRIRGFYGVKNLGDDYILLSLLQLIENSKHKINSVAVESFGGEDGLKDVFAEFPTLNFKVLDIKKYNRFREIIDSIKTDIYIFGGGGLFPNDKFIEYNFLYKNLKRYSLLSTKNYILGIDLCSLREDSSRDVWTRIMPLCEKVIFRNKFSYELIEKIKKTENNSFGPDLTFALDNKYEKDDFRVDIYGTLGISEEQKYIVWAVANPWNDNEMQDEHFKERYRTLIQQLIETYSYYESLGYKIVFVPFYHSRDVEFINDILVGLNSNPIIIDENINIWKKRAIFKYAEACVSMRFHGVAFSLYHGTPVAAISYAPKTSEMMSECGLDDYYCEYGIRDTQTFFKEFDLDITRFKRVCKNVLTDDAKESFISASKKLRQEAQIYKDII